EQGPATIVHGDYRLDNCMLSPDGTIAAVLDWELCTLGDPLADVGLLLVYWNDPGERSVLPDADAALTGLPTKAQLVARYAAASGRDVSDVGYYVAFGYWKLACILEGVYARYRGGVMGESGGYEGFAATVEMLARQAGATIDGLAPLTTGGTAWGPTRPPDKPAPTNRVCARPPEAGSTPGRPR